MLRNWDRTTAVVAAKYRGGLMTGICSSGMLRRMFIFGKSGRSAKAALLRRDQSVALLLVSFTAAITAAAQPVQAHAALDAYSPEASHPVLAEFSLATGSGPAFITRGPGGVWFTENQSDKIGRISPDGQVTEFPLPPGSGPQGITAGPGGNIWFAENGNLSLASGPPSPTADAIGRITSSGHMAEFPLPPAAVAPHELTAAPDGDVWFTEPQGNRIGRITPSGHLTEFLIPTPHATPDGITAGPDGSIWFTESTVAKIGRIALSGQITEFPVPTLSEMAGITAGPDGNIWFTERAVGKIGRMTPSGKVTEFSLPGASSQPAGIGVGPDGNIWFTELTGNKIGRITPSGRVTEFSLSAANSTPAFLTAGPGRSIWFTEFGSNRIGRLSLGGCQGLSGCRSKWHLHGGLAVLALRSPERAGYGQRHGYSRWYRCATPASCLAAQLPAVAGT
jgi:virginiamycin B lyase